MTAQAFHAAASLINGDPEVWIAEFAQLAALDTSFPPGDGYAQFADALEPLFAPLGFEFERVTVPERLCRPPRGPAGGPRINLIGGRRSGKPVCSLYFHTDVVPPGDGWSGDPFQLRHIGEKLIARGTSDMKGTIIAALMALRAAAAANLPLVFDPQLLFCTDEEGGLYPGVRYLAEQRLIEGHVLCFNGGAAPRIWAGCFGSLDLEIAVTGRAGHSGDSLRAINAVEAAMPIVEALLALKPLVEARTSVLPPPPHFEGRPLNARLSITAIHGGAKGSALPGLCTILVNRRFMPEESYETVLAEMEHTVRGAAACSPALSVETALAGLLMPVCNPDGDTHWPRWKAALSYGFGYAPPDFARWGSSSSSDMGFVQAAGIQEILLGGLSRPGNNGHGADEFTTISDIRALASAILFYLSGQY